MLITTMLHRQLKKITLIALRPIQHPHHPAQLFHHHHYQSVAEELEWDYSPEQLQLQTSPDELPNISDIAGKTRLLATSRRPLERSYALRIPNPPPPPPAPRKTRFSQPTTTKDLHNWVQIYLVTKALGVF